MLRGEYGDSETFVLRWFTEISHVDHPRTTRNDRDSFVLTDSSCGSHFRSLVVSVPLPLGASRPIRALLLVLVARTVRRHVCEFAHAA